MLDFQINEMTKFASNDVSFLIAEISIADVFEIAQQVESFISKIGENSKIPKISGKSDPQKGIVWEILTTYLILIAKLTQPGTLLIETLLTGDICI